jgi:hypothetical protein
MKLPMELRLHAYLAFTVIEALLVVAVALLIVFLFVSVGRWIRGTVTGSWTTSPATIPPAPGSGAFVYTVTFNPLGAVKPLGGRVIEFELGPASLKGSGRLVSVTDANGATTALPADAMTCSGTTDATGLITLTVSLEANQSGEIVAKDKKSGATDPAIKVKAQ